MGLKPAAMPALSSFLSHPYVLFIGT